MAAALEGEIPCEFCDKLIPLTNYDPHWRACSQEFKKVARSSIESNTSTVFSIPCEFCEALVSSTEYDQHTRVCTSFMGRDINRLFKNNDQTPIPCDYCQQLVTKREWKQHRKTCSRTEYVEFGATSNHNSLATQNELIPCEYCNKSIQARKYTSHERECRRKNNALTNRPDTPLDIGLGANTEWPEYWDATAIQNLTRYKLDQNTPEYAFVANNFRSSLPQNTIVQIERIQNRRWYRQYAAHKDDFIERYGQSTEQWLFHGCRRGDSAEAIIKDCFNRSHAVNCAVGQGIYFATKAAISFGYTAPDSQGHRHMFMARVLVGKTTRGNRSTRVCPPGFDTTGGGDVFVTYHDAQAYGQYIIVFR